MFLLKDNLSFNFFRSPRGGYNVDFEINGDKVRFVDDYTGLTVAGAMVVEAIRRFRLPGPYRFANIVVNDINGDFDFYINNIRSNGTWVSMKRNYLPEFVLNKGV